MAYPNPFGRKPKVRHPGDFIDKGKTPKVDRMPYYLRLMELDERTNPGGEWVEVGNPHNLVYLTPHMLKVAIDTSTTHGVTAHTPALSPDPPISQPVSLKSALHVGTAPWRPSVALPSPRPAP